MRKSWATLKRVAGGGCALALLVLPRAWGAGPDTVVARAVEYHVTVHGYATVVPSQQVTIRAGLDGTLQGFEVSAGQAVSAGETLGHIGGPDAQAAVAKANAAFSAAEKELAAARETERSVARRYPGFSDRARLDDARAALARAEDKTAEAKAEFERITALTSITSPAGGRIVRLQAAAGDRVAEHQALLQIDPVHELRAEAVFYGSDAQSLDRAATLQFVPADASAPIALHVGDKLPEVRADGGVTVSFTAAGSASWRSGETGEVIATGGAQEAVMLPTDALILDQGRWWVMVADNGAAHPVSVTPGPSRGGDTVILSGVAAGTPVLVRDAYLRFHSHFSEQYTAPD